MRKWERVFGKQYWSMHHYCDTLLHINRANKVFGANKRRRPFLRTAEDNLDYMLGNSDPSFVLLPEIMTKKGRVVASRGRKPEAQKLLSKGSAIKPESKSLLRRKIALQ